MKVKAHYRLHGVVAPLSATVDVPANWTDDDVKAGIRKEIKDSGVHIGGKVPRIKEVFFINAMEEMPPLPKS